MVQILALLFTAAPSVTLYKFSLYPRLGGVHGWGESCQNFPSTSDTYADGCLSQFDKAFLSLPQISLKNKIAAA